MFIGREGEMLFLKIGEKHGLFYFRKADVLSSYRKKLKNFLYNLNMLRAVNNKIDGLSIKKLSDNLLTSQ